jgi:hypothetical protein
VRRLFERLGIDVDQWKALTRTALRIDWRTMPSLRESARRRGRRSAFFQLALYIFMGAIVTVVILPMRDLLLSGTIVLSYVMFMVATAALLDHSATVVSPEDYGILGFRPIGSRTYFAARLTNVLVYTTAMTTLFGILPLTAMFVRHGVGVGLAGVAAVYAGATATVLVMTAAYVSLLRVVGPTRLRRALSYLQLVLSTATYGGYFLITRVLTSNARAGMEMPRSPWLVLWPPTWFAGYLELAAGRGSRLELTLAVLSVLALLGLCVSLLGRLSIDYSERLGAVMAMSVGTPSVSRRSQPRRWFFRSGESRAVALLIWSQFRNDTRFQMGVLAILPMTVIYMIMGLRQGMSPAMARFGRGSPLVTVAMLIFPVMLKTSLVRSDAYRASWIFFASPSDRARLLRSAKSILVVTFLLPYMLLTGLAMILIYHDVKRVLVQLLLVGLLSHLLLQIATLIEPELPFSKPTEKGSSSSRIFVFTILTGVGAFAAAFLAPALYGNTLAVLLIGFALIGVSILLERWTRLRVERRAAGLEFQG